MSGLTLRAAAAGLVLVAAATGGCARARDGARHLAKAGPGVAAQVAAPTVSLGGADRRRYEAFRHSPAGGPPVILVYHDVQPDPVGPYTVSPRQLASHLAMLRAAGYVPVTAAQVVGWLSGRPLPRHAVLVTFDDSTKGTWVYGDPVLAAAGFHAVSFAITGWVGTHQPYYLTWNELQAMHGSGRWDIESHSRLGHQRLPIDAGGTTGPDLINRLWLSGQGRIETLEEFGARSEADLRRSKADLVAHRLPDPSLFAYPFSAAAVPTNDPAAADRTAGTVRRLFAAGLVDSATAGAITAGDLRTRVLRRLDVGTATTADALFDLVAGSTASPLRSMQPLSEPGLWTDHSGGVLDHGTIANGGVHLDPGPGGWQGADFDAARDSLWSGYRTSARVTGLSVHGDGGFAGVRVLIGDPNQLQIAVSGDWLSVRRGLGDAETSVLEAPLPPSDAHVLVVSLLPGRTEVAVDGARPATIPMPDGARGGMGVMVRRAGASSPTPVLGDLSIDARRPDRA
jgi:poly-beta-1,6-N-acetyl-D-glucosamine N-deacetylase